MDELKYFKSEIRRLNLVVDRYAEKIDKMSGQINTLERLILLTHRELDSEEVNELSIKQWKTYLNEFPEVAKDYLSPAPTIRA